MKRREAAAILLGQSHRPARRRLADEDVLAAPFDCAVATHAPHLVLGVLPGCVGLGIDGLTIVRYMV